MTRGRKSRVQSEVLEATSVEDAVAKLQALKRQRGASAADPASGPVAASATPPLPAEPLSAEPIPAGPAPAEPPRKRGRPPKTSVARPTPAGPAPDEPASAEPAPPTFGVSRVTAHRPLGLLEVQEPADLDALLADPKLAPLIASRLDPHFALVLPASLERLQSALLKAGHTPRLSGPASGSTPERAERAP